MSSKFSEELKDQGLTYTDFCWLAREHPSVVSRFIHGKQKISRRKQFKWSKALGVKPQSLFPNGK